jgi:DNA-binding NtrC family response regulator
MMSPAELDTAIFTRMAQAAIDSGLASFTEFSRNSKRAFILEHLAREHGNISRAARNMGLHRNTLARNIEELGIAVPRGLRFAAGKEKAHETTAIAG